MTAPSKAELDVALVAACRDRQDRLSAKLPEQGLDALLVSCETDIRYLTGFVGHDSLLLMHDGQVVIISDPRYDEFLQPWRRSGVADVVMGVRHRLFNDIAAWRDRTGVKRLGVQAEHLTLASRGRLAAAVGADRLVETSGLVGGLRMRKDAMEIDTIERAVVCQQVALSATLEHLRIGMTELQFGARLEYEMKIRGAFGPSFDFIIGSGPNSAVIHHLTGESPIEQGMLLVDWGATIDGYCSDMTRTFGVGTIPPKMAEIYPIVLEAQLAAIAACRPGRTCAEIDAVARDVITAAGYGDQFGHGLGHGLGLEIHEEPYFNDLGTDVVLEPGMVMTVEPGIYLPGHGGVRIEDDVVITEDGCRVLGDWPKDLAAVRIEPACTEAATPAVRGLT